MQIVALMICTIRLSKNDSEASKSILQISDIMGVIGLRDVFTVTGPKYRCNNKHHTTS